LPRDSKMQSTHGIEVPGRASAIPGDLFFFGSDMKGIYHVGLLLPCSEIIHASTMVRVDDITDEGIRNRETGEISHRTAAIRRVLP
jgi:cell wall-associated NlpC family hydrolase